MKNWFMPLLCLILLFSVSLYAQKDTVRVPDTYDMQGAEGTLNDSVQAVINRGALSNTVFKLKQYGLYVLTGSIITPSGAVLEIVADAAGNTQETSPPMICWTESTAPTKTFLFDIAGEVKMKNIWLLWSGKNGTRFASTIRVGDSATVSGGRCEFENVIFDYVYQNSSGAITPFATHFRGIFRNCYFRNNTDAHFRYYSRAVSFPWNTTGLHSDTVLFENCTFANIGYVYMQEGAEYGDNVHFDHCTFYNVVMFSLESGWWWKMSVTNSLFVNTFMFGAMPGLDGQGAGGTIGITRVDSIGFTVPFTEQDRRILFVNNSYHIEQWLVDWMGYGPNGCPYSKEKHRIREDDLIPVPMPMMNDDTRLFFDSLDAQGNRAYPYMNAANLDSASNPRLVLPPLNLDSLKSFLNRKWDDNSDCEWAWKPENSYQDQKWPSEENLAYANDTLKTAAMYGFPLGDLYHWWPDKYAEWAQKKDIIKERIRRWLENGVDPDPDQDYNLSSVERLSNGNIPSVYVLGQNYPNPFNPTTQIEYSVPERSNISLKVYNLLGQEVATLFSGDQKAGNYIATFDGRGLSSGVYFYRLESGSISLTKKFVLMK
jgi:hypothetical protein